MPYAKKDKPPRLHHAVLNRFAKIILFLFAYCPLFLILSILSFDSVPNQALYILMGVLVVSLAIWWLVKMLLNTSSQLTPKQAKFTKRANNSTDLASFVVSYLLPLFYFPSSVPQTISFSLVFLFLGYLYIDSTLVAVNPSLKLFFGYNSYSGILGTEEVFLLSRIKHTETSNVKYVKITEGIFIEV